MPRKYVLTGGAGFIGTNYAARLIARGDSVRIVDNLARSGSAKNLAWLGLTFGSDAFEFVNADVRNDNVLPPLVRDADAIVHLAAQVAVTTSIADPRSDFATNALGTFNVIEAARLSGRRPRVLYTSTNKVYGAIDDLRIAEHETRYAYADPGIAIAEGRPLDFHSPYGCSKGAGDQYVRDYARIYGLPTTVFRMSCICGTRQFGVEEQGWVAWMIIAAVTGRKVSIFGDGKQVRDVLFIEDLLDAFDAALVDSAPAGEVFNIGGGVGNTISVWREFGPLLEGLVRRKVDVSFHDWRAGDQKVYVSDISKAARVLGWAPKIPLSEGMRELHAWISSNRHLFV